MSLRKLQASHFGSLLLINTHRKSRFKPPHRLPWSLVVCVCVCPCPQQQLKYSSRPLDGTRRIASCPNQLFPIPVPSRITPPTRYRPPPSPVLGVVALRVQREREGGRSPRQPPHPRRAPRGLTSCTFPLLLVRAASSAQKWWVSPSRQRGRLNRGGSAGAAVGKLFCSLGNRTPAEAGSEVGRKILEYHRKFESCNIEPLSSPPPPKKKPTLKIDLEIILGRQRKKKK